MRFVKALAIAVVMLVSVRPAYTQDQQLYTVGIHSEVFNYFASPQHNSNWCWAASLQMIFNYYGINITQEQIVARSYGVDPNGTLPDWTGNWQVITANLNNWSVDNNGRQYMVRAVFNQGPPDPLYLVRELAAGHPVLIGYQSGPNSGHAVVITACSYMQTYYGPIIQSVVVRDPWPDQDNIANEGRKEWAGRDLANLIQGHWFIFVSY
jgi:hypothetical protein